jgi:hypothetical protein
MPTKLLLMEDNPLQFFRRMILTISAFSQGLFFFGSFLASSQGRAELQTQVIEWTGTELADKEGAFYLKVQLEKFPAQKDGIVVEQSIQISFYNIIERKEYVVSQVISDVKAPPNQIWRIGAGKYQITKLSFVDDQGVIRVWKPKKRGKSFVVQRKSLSNLGLLTILPLGTAGLKAKLVMVPNTYKDERAILDHLLTSVIDGYTEIQQGILAGDKALAKDTQGVKARSQLQAEVSVTRKVAMYFQLDLFKHNQHAKAMIQVLAQHDPSFRACYIDSLRENDQLRGQVKFSLLFSKSIASIKKLKFSGGSLTAPNMVRCLFTELHNLNFPVPENMIGELTFTFDVKY